MVHNKIKQNVSELMLRLEFPEHAYAELISALDKILGCDTSAAVLDELLSIYDEDVLCDHADMLERLKSATSGIVHEYTATMLFYLALGERLKERYIERGIDIDVFYASLCDLRYKLEECRLVYGIVGTFAYNWFQGFYRLRRFAFGRLQFEVLKSPTSFNVGDVHITEETKVINIHIPRTGGRLDHDDVMKSYALAADFFRPQLEGNVIFHCKTWLLESFNKTVLSESSNMMRFIRDYTIVEEGLYKDYVDVWRLFDKNYDGNPDHLPADSSLRRAYIERIRKGEPLGWARGFFIYN